MITASELRKIASEYQPKIESTLENSLETVEYFTKDLETCAERGKFFKKTTCLVANGDSKDGIKQKFNCQTTTGGDGFTVENIEEVIGLLKDQGFKVEFKIKSGYCPFNISWE